jgi:hypothetical protein
MSYVIPRRSTNTGYPDIVGTTRSINPYKTVKPALYLEKANEVIFAPLGKLTAKLQFTPAETGTLAKTLVWFKKPKATGGKTHKWENKDVEYQVLTSPLFPNVYVLNFKTEGDAVDHRTTFIKRGDHTEYYDSNGNTISQLPVELRAKLENDFKLNTIYKRLEENTEKLQEGDSCGYYSNARSCFSHLTNAEFNALIKARAKELKISEDQVVYTLGLETAKDMIKERKEEMGATGKKIVEKEVANPLVMGDEPPKSAKKGGLIRGKKNQAVPIIAHEGELVVPKKTVPAVLHSSAWKNHIEEIARSKNLTFAAAKQYALGNRTIVKKVKPKKKSYWSDTSDSE